MQLSLVWPGGSGGLELRLQQAEPACCGREVHISEIAAELLIKRAAILLKRLSAFNTLSKAPHQSSSLCDAIGGGSQLLPRKCYAN